MTFIYRPTDRLRDFLHGDTYPKQCKFCSKEFQAAAKNRQYCSVECRETAREIQRKEYNDNRYVTIAKRNEILKEKNRRKNQIEVALEVAKEESDKMRERNNLLVRPRMG